MEDCNAMEGNVPKSLVFQRKVNTTCESDDQRSESIPQTTVTRPSARYDKGRSRTAGNLFSERFLRTFDDLVVTMNIPKYIMDNMTILRFPEKVSNRQAAERPSCRSKRSPCLTTFVVRNIAAVAVDR
jgi:hypothetical protein